MQREVPGDLGAGTSSYSVMPSNIAPKFPRYFEIRSLRNWFTSLFLQQWSLWCSAFSFGNISFITFWQFVCITSFYLSLTVILTSHFSNITYFRQQQQQNKPMKYYEILPTHCETPRNTTRKIANLYIEFNYHFLTLQKKIPLLLNRSVQNEVFWKWISYNWHLYKPMKLMHICIYSFQPWTKPLDARFGYNCCTINAEVAWWDLKILFHRDWLTSADG